MAAAKSNLKKVTLELGGKSPSIVFADADGKEYITAKIHISIQLKYVWDTLLHSAPCLHTTAFSLARDLPESFRLVT